MQCEVLGFRYATNRWLALVGLSLISFLLILKYLPFLHTIVVRFYRWKINNNIHTISIHAFMDHAQGKHHTTQALSIRSKHVSDI
jgi:hypothetical protein